MTALPPAALVGLGGALGAVLRTVVADHVPAENFPAGTLVVNVVGSFALGVVAFAGAGEPIVSFVGTGACGAFTTFSSFSVDTVRLAEDGEYRLAVANALGNLLGAGLALALAWVLTHPSVG